MIGYSGLEVFDVFLFDSFMEGYKLNDSTAIVLSWIQSIQVYENINLLFPSFKISWTDRGSAYFDKRNTGQLLIRLGYEKDKAGFWDFAIGSRRGDRGLTVLHQAEMKRQWYGYDMLGVWLSEKKTRGFKGLRKASEVVEEVVEEVFNKYTEKIGKTFSMKIQMNVEQSTDLVNYLQLGDSTTKFLYYLRDKAIANDGSGFISWIDRRGFDKKGRTNDIQFNFVSIRSLIEQKVKWYIEFDPSSDALETTKKNSGLFRKSPPTLLALNIAIGSVDWKPTEKVGKIAGFDINNLKFNVKDFKFIEDIGKKVTVNVLENYMRQLKDVDKYINVGRVEGKEIDTGFAHAFRSKFNKRVYVLVVGYLGVKLGDKVRVLVPNANSEMVEWISGDWIVSSITHFFSFPELKYFMKLGLVNSKYSNER